MANSVTTQTVIDGPRHVIIKFEGVLDTSDVSSMTVVDPALLSDMNINGIKASQLRIDKIVFDVEDTLSVNLFWDATTPVRIWELAGRGKIDARHYGGMQNNSTTGKTGKITATTQGWAASSILSFVVILECVKQ